MKNSVSIIIPSFNRANYLSEAVDSALAQKDVELEVIVVDDGSTDNTAQVVEENGPRWGERFKYVWQPNSERCVARNNGFSHASGDYVAFLDSDDVWKSDHLATCLLEFSKSPEISAVFSEYGLMSAEGRPITTKVSRPIAKDEAFSRLLCLKRIILHPTELILRRSILSSTLPFDVELTAGEDWLLWVQLNKHHRFLGTGKATVWMRVHPNGTFGEPVKFARSLLLAAQKVISTGLPEQVGIDPRRIIAINLVHSAYAFYLGGDFITARDYLSRAFSGYSAILLDGDFWKVAARLSLGRSLTSFIRGVRQQGRGASIKGGENEVR